MSKAKNQKPMSTLDWLIEQSNQGRTLEIVWEGGGDSGWVHFEMDGEDYSNCYTELLIDHMHDELNYGSWAGEFTANGRAEFNPETNCFEGTDFYGEDESQEINTEINISVPDNLWFDSLRIEAEGSYDERIRVAPRFVMKNGFETPEHKEFLREIEENLHEQINDEIEKFARSEGVEVRYCYNDFNIPYSQFNKSKNSGFLTTCIDTFNISVYNEDDRPVCLDLTEIEDVHKLFNEKGEIIEDESV